MPTLAGIRRNLIDRLLDELASAQAAIDDALRSVTDADIARRLTRQRAEIQRVMAAFRDAALHAVNGSVDVAWVDGARNVQDAVGVDLTPRISIAQLTATQNFLTRLISDVSRDTVRAIDSALTQHLLGVRDMSATVTQVQGLLGGTRRRAMTIAYTEVGRAYASAQHTTMLQQAKHIPNLRKRWIHNPRMHPRPGHILAAADPPIPVAESFRIIDTRTGEIELLRYPRDPNASPGNTVNCGCMMATVVPKNADDIFAGPIRGIPAEDAGQT